MKGSEVWEWSSTGKRVVDEHARGHGMAEAGRGRMDARAQVDMTLRGVMRGEGVPWDA